MKQLIYNSLRMLLASLFFVSLSASCQNRAAKTDRPYSTTTQKLVDLVEHDSRIKSLLSEAIEGDFYKLNP